MVLFYAGFASLLGKKSQSLLIQMNSKQVLHFAIIVLGIAGVIWLMPSFRTTYYKPVKEITIDSSLIAAFVHFAEIGEAFSGSEKASTCQPFMDSVKMESQQLIARAPNCLSNVIYFKCSAYPYRKSCLATIKLDSVLKKNLYHGKYFGYQAYQTSRYGPLIEVHTYLDSSSQYTFLELEAIAPDTNRYTPRARLLARYASHLLE